MDSTEDQALSTEVQGGGLAEADHMLRVQRAQTRSRLIRFWIRTFIQVTLAFVVLFGAVQFMGFLIFTQPRVPIQPPREQYYTVNTEPIQIADNRPIITLHGEIVPSRQAELRSLVSGLIEKVSPKLKAGAVIEKGHELLKIDDFEYQGAVLEAEVSLSEAKARLIEAKLAKDKQLKSVEVEREQLEIAERDLERSKKLLESGTLSEAGLDQKQSQYNQQLERLQQLENGLEVSDLKIEQQETSIMRAEWKLEQAEKNVENTVLRAPFDSIVLEEKAEIGQTVGGSAMVAILYEYNSLEARFTLSDAQFGRLLSETGTLQGKELQIEWDVGTEPKIYPAVIERIGGEVVADRGGVDVYARVIIEGTELIPRPGAFVKILLPDKLFKDTVVMPEAATYDASYVFVKTDENRMQKRDITVLAYDNNNVVVTGDLSEGETLILTRIAEAGDGILVEDLDNPEDPNTANLNQEDKSQSNQNQRSGQAAASE